jgi:phosphoglycerol transferase MdoB-like AlkP superfamily enzyme
VLDSLYGLRFDNFSIFASNSLFILLSLLPFSFFYSKIYQSILKWTFFLTNSVFILANCVDIGYFPYIKKRSGADLLNQVGGQTDISKLLPQYLRDFWWVFIIYIVLIVLMVFLYMKIKVKDKPEMQKTSWKQAIAIFLLFVFLLGLAVLGIRGGLQRIPLDIVDAGGMASPEEAPIVLNTPFSIIKSLDKKTLPEYHFYSDEELKKYFNPVHHFSDLQFKKQNVVVLMLESFAKEYTKLGRTVSYTPFLDSLMNHSLVFTSAYANGAKSIEGIPAILSSLPTLMENPVINSAYSNNFQTSFANLLGKEGYTTAFFHGGTNGTMNFDAYAKLAGYDSYFGRKEYNNDADFDGFWGIWDEPFLQYSVIKMSAFKEPFHSAIFTLSSHHPYQMPEKYKGKYPKGHLENSESIGYADDCLRKFFNAAKKTSWYNNTLFVLCADHASISENAWFANSVGQKSIPILFFKGDNSMARNCDSSFSQIDILPSVMNVIGYNKPFFSMGQSFLKRTNNNCCFYENGSNLVVCDTLLLCFREGEAYQVNNLRRDSLLQNNMLGKYPEAEKKIITSFRAFIQTYNHTLISNSASVKPE